MNSTEKLKHLASLNQKTWSEDTRKKIGQNYKTSKIKTQADMEAWFEKWMQDYCSESVKREVKYDGKIIYKLTDGCIFDRNHKDASVIIQTDGTICYNCFHDSCSNKHWSDFRFTYEPYSNRQNDAWK